jgi:hypothetical protein
MAFPDRLRLPLSFDPLRLKRDLDELSSVAWIAHFVKENYEGDWSAIPLRSVAGARYPSKTIYADPIATAFEDAPALEHCDYFREVLGDFGCEFRCVRLMRLTPGSVINEHDDLDLNAEFGVARIHIPITTNPGVEFELNRVPVVMEPGSAWYLRLSDPHRVANRGTTDRVHLVADAVVKARLTAMLEQAASEVALA